MHDHFWSCPCAGAQVGGMITASQCLSAPGAPDTDPAPRSQRVGYSVHGGRAGSWHHHLVQRSLVLFSVGVVLALVLNLLQIQRNVVLFPDEVIVTMFSSAWWVLA
jgi:hypothetical protein